MRTNLKGFVKNFGNKRDWGGLWSEEVFLWAALCQEKGEQGCA